MRAVADWATWTDLRVSVSLLPGANQILLRTAGTSGPNLDSLQIERVDANAGCGTATSVDAFILAPLSTAACPSGTAALGRSECLPARQALATQGKFSYPAKRGLVEGSWPGVPVGCSVQYADEPADRYVSSNQDQSPHWNSAATSDNSRVASGEFRLICRVKAAAVGTAFGFQERIVECLRNNAIISDDVLCSGSRPAAIKHCEIPCASAGQAATLPRASGAPEATHYLVVSDKGSNPLVIALVALALLAGLVAVITVTVYFYKARNRERTVALTRAESHRQHTELSVPVEAIPIRIAHVLMQPELGRAMHTPVGQPVHGNVAIGTEVEMQEIRNCTVPSKYGAGGPSMA